LSGVGLTSAQAVMQITRPVRDDVVVGGQHLWIVKVALTDLAALLYAQCSRWLFYRLDSRIAEGAI
jgi:hypothetical protein